MTKRGRPVVLNDAVRIGSELTAEMSDTLDQLVSLTRESRASVVRRGVGLVLQEAGLWDTARGAQTIITTPTRKDHS